MDGYNIFCHDLNNNNGRGVLFYIASDVQVSILDNPSAFQECLLLMISGKTTRKMSQQLLIGIIYRIVLTVHRKMIKNYTGCFNTSS